MFLPGGTRLGPYEILAHSTRKSAMERIHRSRFALAHGDSLEKEAILVVTGELVNSSKRL
jgi:hypothetical protein